MFDLADAHCHSLFSDGTCTWMQLASLAKRSRLAAVVVTDHDTFPDSAEYLSLRAVHPEIFPGAEWSVRLGRRSLHLLAYGFDLANAGLQSLRARRLEHRRERWQFMVNNLRERKYKLDSKIVDRLAGGRAPGRRQLARELVRSGSAPSIRLAFSRILSRLPPFEPTDEISFADAITAIHQAGGKASLAHPPGDLLLEEWRQLVDNGLDAIECSHPSLQKNHRQFLTERIKEYGLLATAGSDYHGDEPANFLGSKTMTLDLLDELFAGTFQQSWWQALRPRLGTVTNSSIQE